MARRIRWLLGPFIALLAGAALLGPGDQGPSPAAAAASPDRFGVVVNTTDAAVAQRVLQQLGISWWYTFAGHATNAAGGRLVYLIKVTPTGNPLPASTLQTMVSTNPGAYWLIGNEPNVPGQDDVTPARYAELLQYYATTIKGLDATAKLVGPNALNWNRTCSGCGGFTASQAWVPQFVSAYQTRYGSAPPLDVWGIHAYTISWDVTPMADAPVSIEQVSGFRDYLNGLPAEAAKPIWVTEFGVIWGYDGWELRDGKISPTGSFRTDRIQAYLNQFVGWLNDNAESKRIDRWFLYTSFGSPEPYASVYAGVSLMTTGGSDAGLSAFGETYRILTGVTAPAPAPPSSGGGSGGGGGGSPRPTPAPDRGGPTGLPPESTVPESRTANVSIATGGTVTAGTVQVEVPPGIISGSGTVSIQIEPVTLDVASRRHDVDALLAAVRLPTASEGQMLGTQIFSLKVLDGSGTPVEQLARSLTIVNLASAEDIRRTGNRAEGLTLSRLDAASNSWSGLSGSADLATRKVTATTDRTGIIALLLRIPAARLQDPPSGTLSVAMDPLLSWEVPPNAVWHQVQVLPANNDGPAINLIIGAPDQVAAGRYQVPAPKLGVGNYILLPGMTYTWRVRMSTLPTFVPESAPGWSAWDARTFRTAPPASTTLAPVTPQPGTIAASRTPALTWSNLNDRIFYYEIQLSQDPNFETDPNRAVAAVYWELLHGGQTTPTNSYQVRSDYPLDPGSLYYWRVRARVQGDGIPVDWSTTWTFLTP